MDPTLIILYFNFFSTFLQVDCGKSYGWIINDGIAFLIIGCKYNWLEIIDTIYK